MAGLRRLGKLAGVLLDDQLARDRDKYQSELTLGRQQQLAKQGLLDKMATTLGPMLASRKMKLEDAPEEYRDMLSPYAAAAPTDEMVKADVTGAVGKEMNAATTPEALGTLRGRFDESMAGMHERNTPIDLNDVTNLGQAFNQKADVIGNADITKRERDVADHKQEAQDSFNIGHPEEKVVFQSIDANGKPSGPLLVQDPSAKGGYRPATNEDKLQSGAVHYIEGRESAYYGLGNEMGPLDQAGIDMYARQVAKGGPLPTLYGMTGNTDKRKIINRAAQWNYETNDFDVAPGNGPDMTNNRIDVGAAKGSIDQLTKNIGAVGAFKKTADKNSALLKDVMKGIPSQNMPTFINSEIRDLARTFGDKPMAAFEIARQSVSTEYGRLIRQPSLTGVFTNDAAGKMDAAMSENATVGQILAALDILNQESTNREIGFNEELAQMKHNLPGNAAPPRGGAPVAPKLPPGVTVTRR